ncbi:DNRLRE domain-containing protein [Streptomyces sp. NPDC001185]|uniref:DNRLRE domain-containing protein n=1 Tax=Streptomyces sp. NPDC001185 TaxID=3154380 RepID=UPI00331B95D2
MAVVLAVEAALIAGAPRDGSVASPELPVPMKTVSAKVQGPPEARDDASALLMARLQDRKIEVLSDRSADSTTYALPDGQMSTASYAGPIRVKQDGEWQDIDTALSDTGPSLTPAATAADVAVSDGGDTALASVAKGDKSFGLGWQDTLPAPTVKNDTASYSLGDGQKLTVTALPQGFSQNVVLADQPDQPVSYRFPLDLDGLKLSQGESGHLFLKDSEGKLVAEAPAPMMWDSTKNEASGESEHQAQVATKIETDDDGKQALVLTPAADFLAAAAYPVTVDPTSTLAATTDTWVQTPDYLDSQVSSTELKSGTYDDGGHVARSYLMFNVDKFAGKHITDTNLSLYSYYASTCATTGAGTQVRRITGSWSSSTVTWGAQPTTTATGAVTNKAALGYNSSCPAGTVNFDIDAIVQAWADGSANYGLQVRGASETDTLTWRRFRSANYSPGVDDPVEPHLTVTYNSYATTSALGVSPSAVNAYNGTRYATSLTPLLSAKVADLDGGTAKAQFEVTPNPTYNDAGTYAYTGTSASVGSGSTAKLSVPSASAFPSGSHLRVRVRAYDGTDYGAWSGYTNFTLNTARPVAPTVTCAPYAPDAWTDKATNGASCVLATTSADGQGFYWGLDDPNVPQRFDDTDNGTGGDPLTITIKPDEGWHTLYVKTIDSGGNVSSATTSYTFGVGGAAVLTPLQGDRPNSTVALTSRGNSGATGVTYQYRRGSADSWQDVPTSDVTKTSDGSSIGSWPLSVNNQTSAALTWNITKTLSQDGPVDIRTKFSGATAKDSPAITVTVDRWGGADIGEDISSGGVNAVTGDQTLSPTDATVFGMNATRTASSRRPNLGADQDGQAPIYGPQWMAGLTVDRTSTNWVYLRQTSPTSVAAVRADGSTVGFTSTTAGDWVSEPGSQTLTLSGSLSGDFTLKHTDGSVTKFTKVASDAPAWQMTSTSMPTSNSTTTVVWEKTTQAGQTLARPKYVIAPTTAASPDTCQATPAANGCRLLEYVYADSTTATADTLGDIAGQVKQIKLWATSPADTKATATPVSAYAYDSDGRLREAWDPRIFPALKTAYTYTSAGCISTVTPPGELPWTYTYGQVTSTDPSGPGMLLSVSRPTLNPGSATAADGTAVTNVVYNVALNGSHAPYDLSASTVATWGQTQAPVGGTAVLPADAAAKAPTGNDGANAVTSDFARANVTYFNSSGRSVNTAEPGGHIATTQYDTNGLVASELTAANRELAMASSGDRLDQLAILDIDGLPTPKRARQLSTESVYSPAADLLDQLGPLHEVVLQSPLKAGSGGTDRGAGDSVPARQHTVNTYDEGRPTDGTAKVSGQPTTSVTSGYVDGYPAGADPRTVKTAYDWAIGLPTKETEDPSGKNVTRTTGYDSQGRTITEKEPMSSGTDAGTTSHRYWTSTGTGLCQGHPEWADLECTAGPVDTSGGATQTTEYDRWGQPAKSVITGGSQTSTITMTTDDAGRAATRTATGTGDQAAPKATTSYDPATGKIAAIASANVTITHAYDSLGREISYSDGNGNTTTTEYDSLDRPTKVTDSSPSTTTYTYDAAKDPRGLATSMNDSVAGAMTATYDSDGTLSTEKIPGNIVLSIERDPAGNDVSRTYVTDAGTVAFSDNTTVNVHDQDATRSQTKGSSVGAAYTYDALGRAAGTHIGNWFSCTDESYDYDDNSNLKKLTTQNMSCLGVGTPSTTETARSYDSAGHVTTDGYTYDGLGRPTAQPDRVATAYYGDNSVYRETHGDSRDTAVYDATVRPTSVVTETLTNGVWGHATTAKYHYGDSNKQAAWQEGTSVIRHVNDVQDNPVADTGASGNVVVRLIGLDGETAVQLPADDSQAPVVDPGDNPTISPLGAIGFQSMKQFDFEFAGVTIHVPIGCEIGHRIHGSGRRITEQAGWVGCDDFTGSFSTGFCNWHLDFHYADSNGKTYKILKGGMHTSCTHGPWREIGADRTLAHYGKACVHFVVGGKDRGVQCHQIHS